MKRPAFQFYPADWRKDVELRSCSIAARGLWIDMLCIAHECEPYGHLTVNGKAMTAAQIAGQVGLPALQCAKLLSELLDNGVARKTASGVIYSKRMTDDEADRERRAEIGREHGHKGAEHGSKGGIHGIKGGRPSTSETPGQNPGSQTTENPGSKPPQEPPQNPPPSSSSSSSSSNNTPNPRKRGRSTVHGFPPGFDPLWVEYPKKAAKDAAAKAFARLAPDDALLARMLAAVRQQKRSEQWTKDGGAFVPNFSTWINGRRWEDELPMGGAADEPWAGAL